MPGRFSPQNTASQTEDKLIESVPIVLCSISARGLVHTTVKSAIFVPLYLMRSASDNGKFACGSYALLPFRTHSPGPFLLPPILTPGPRSTKTLRTIPVEVGGCWCLAKHLSHQFRRIGIGPLAEIPIPPLTRRPKGLPTQHHRVLEKDTHEEAHFKVRCLSTMQPYQVVQKR